MKQKTQESKAEAKKYSAHKEPLPIFVFVIIISMATLLGFLLFAKLD